jgi:hypothetical protein
MAMPQSCSATDFADWVFNATTRKDPTYDEVVWHRSLLLRLKLGRLAHAEIEEHKRWLKPTKAGPFLNNKWDLVYADPHDVTGHIFRASKLQVHGTPITCQPDVVFKDSETNTIVIVERKTTAYKDHEIPGNAWPNIRAQLWCYGWIDDWCDAREVILVTHFIRRRAKSLSFKSTVKVQNPQFPWIWIQNPRPSWSRTDRDFHEECLSYFLKFGGTFVKER